MQRFKWTDQAQKFLSAHAMIYGHFKPRRHLMAAARLQVCLRQSVPDLAAGDLRPSCRMRLAVLCGSADERLSKC